MKVHQNGNVHSIHRSGAGYVVEARASNGNLIDAMDCATLGEARAALHYPVERW